VIEIDDRAGIGPAGHRKQLDPLIVACVRPGPREAEHLAFLRAKNPPNTVLVITSDERSWDAYQFPEIFGPDAVDYHFDALRRLHDGR
jgi:hypothetical protein